MRFQGRFDSNQALQPTLFDGKLPSPPFRSPAVKGGRALSLGGSFR